MLRYPRETATIPCDIYYYGSTALAASRRDRSPAGGALAGSPDQF